MSDSFTIPEEQLQKGSGIKKTGATKSGATNTAAKQTGKNNRPVTRKPEWLKIQLNTNDNFKDLKKMVKEERLHTVCEEARCPNIHECWGKHKTATFMILGDTCTRRCRFCAVKTGLPGAVDLGEPARVADSVAKLQLAHVVITMVTRDDLKDGGASIVAKTVEEIRKAAPDCGVELLTSDLMADPDSIAAVLESRPDIMSHNLETVERLTPVVRSRSYYQRSLKMLKMSREIAPDIVTKSSLMLGLGETREEILGAMDDLLAHGVSMMNMGQYLQPSRNHQAVQKYWTPEEFAELKERALEKGFDFVEAGPLVRSSYHAGEQYENYRKKIHPLYRK
ncbi:lipoyl synthase [Salinispira pacifica]|uniref:Lipoyl synthase n=1 Tax=Salinispira pacifica TaxID=1307761 RepID=V5WL89_9SPIO|nr:lipoyl synthase [Salinispira pacifica]AHC15966.1 Lipoate synthase [Salinispira pacifica]